MVVEFVIVGRSVPLEVVVTPLAVVDTIHARIEIVVPLVPVESRACGERWRAPGSSSSGGRPAHWDRSAARTRSIPACNSCTACQTRCHRDRCPDTRSSSTGPDYQYNRPVSAQVLRWVPAQAGSGPELPLAEPQRPPWPPRHRATELAFSISFFGIGGVFVSPKRVRQPSCSTRRVTRRRARYRRDLSSRSAQAHGRLMHTPDGTVKLTVPSGPAERPDRCQTHSAGVGTCTIAWPRSRRAICATRSM